MRDYDAAARMLDTLAEQGDAEAQYQLAALYRAGCGVPKNHELAARWFERAAKQNHAKAEYNLGVLYENGWGVEKNAAIAMDWYKKAAKQGHPMALAKLGEGKGRQRTVEEDRDKNKQEPSLARLLHWAALKGDIEEVRKLLDQGTPVDATDDYESTALIQAADQGNEAVARLLAERGASLNHRNRYGETALLKAVVREHRELVVFLVGAGADINQTDANDDTPLILATQSGNRPVVKALLAGRCDVNRVNRKGWSALDVAQRSKNAAIENLLTARGAVSALASARQPADEHRQIRQRIAERDRTESVYQDMPVVVEAAWRGQDEVLKALLAGGEQVNVKDSEGYTALARAAWRGHEAILKMLLGARAERRSGEQGGQDPAHACSGGRARQCGETTDRCGCETGSGRYQRRNRRNGGVKSGAFGGCTGLAARRRQTATDASGRCRSRDLGRAQRRHP